MKITKTLLIAALAAVGLAATAADAQTRSGRGGGGWSGHGGNFHGRGASTGGRHWGGGGHWGGRYWGPRFGVYIGAPLLFGSYYWGSPWWDDYYYPRSTVVYRDRIVEPYPQSYNEVEVSPADVAPRAEGGPIQAPSYRNYCDSARAYYPKVTKCPEGWRFEPAR
jgi:hypothetical protein